MAIVEMSKIRLVGLKSERVKVMDTLSRSHLFEPCSSADIEGAEKFRDTFHLEKVLAKQTLLSFAVQYLSSANNKATKIIKKAKKQGAECNLDYNPQKLSGRQIITYDDFYDCAAKEYELMAKCEELEQLSFQNTELKSERNKIQNKLKSILPYKALPFKFSEAVKTKYTSIIYALANSKTATLNSVREKFDVCAEEFSCDKGTALALVCLIDDENEVKSALNESGWSICTFTYDETAKNLINDCYAQLKNIKEYRDEIFKKTLSYMHYLLELKTLYDFLGADVEKFTAELDFANTQSTYVLEGWIPKEISEEIAAEIKSKTNNVIIYINNPREDENPPTLLDNPKLIKPFESVTKMYSTPSYREKDPNFVMSIFFFIIFGIMMADAGYGLVLALVCTLIVRFTHMEKGIKNFAGIFALGGISAIAFGTLFGSWLGFDLLPALWFNPLKEPIILLAFCIALGLIHMMVGYGYQAYYLIKKGKIFDAIFDVGFIYLLIIGVALMVLPSAFSVPNIISNIGLYCLLGALVGIFLTAGRHKKGIFGKFTGGFGGLYGLVNLFSDALSYARIFGIALAGGAIASAFNSILEVVAGIPYAGMVLALVLGIFLHVFNLLISLLGAYVHNARLQFLEFYGKFYTGGGRQFSPMGERTKYIRFV